jgi:hypothetical protein
MPNTYSLISANTLTTTAASITFSAIPATFTDLVIRASARTNRAATQDIWKIVINGDTAANYSRTALRGLGSGNSGTPVSDNQTSASNLYFGGLDAANNTANTFGSTELYIPNYASTIVKQFSAHTVYEENNSYAEMEKVALRYGGTSAITSIVLSSFYSASFIANSSFFLYGISKS